MPDDTKRILLRLPPDLVERVEAYRAQLEASFGVQVSRNAALAKLVEKGLDRAAGQRDTRGR